MSHTIITLEGTDGCGKETQTNKLYDFYQNQGKDVMKVSFPDYDSPGCAPVKMYLNGEFGDKATCLDAYQASTLFAVDRLCTMKKVCSGLKDSTTLILDRYVQSNMIHQAGKIKDLAERDKYLKWCDDFEFNVLKLPRPDKILFLDVEPRISIKLAKERGRKDIHENDPKHLIRAYENAKYVADKMKWTTIPCTKNGQIKSIEEIHALIIDSI